MNIHIDLSLVSLIETFFDVLLGFVAGYVIARLDI
jgi:hypothetical protein